MMLSSFEIIPNKGLGELHFGTDIETFVNKYGEPEEVQNIEEDEALNTTILHYWKDGFSAFFVGFSAPILAGIEIDHPDATLFDKKILGMTEEELIDLMKKHGFKNFETELEETDKRLSYDVGMMDFFFRENLLIYMNFGVLVDENGEIETV
jgi:hypothetical protein